MQTSLNGVRVVCFYPWRAFEPCGAWSRFQTLWTFLLDQGAEVTLAFFDWGTGAQLKGFSVSYVGEQMVFNNAPAIAQMLARSKSMQELKQYSTLELNFLLSYEKALYLNSPKVGSWLDALVGGHDAVTCEYPMFAPLLSDFCKKWKRPLVVTSHDLLYEFHGSHPRAKERLKEKEIQAYKLGDAVVFCNEGERKALSDLGVNGITILTTGDVLGITPGDEDPCREGIRAKLKLKTAHYCLFVGSSHQPNVDATAEIRSMAKQMPGMSFVVAGSCSAPATDHNFIALGQVPNRFLEQIIRGAFAVLVPLMRGTGISVKLFQAFAYAKPVVSTPIGARGHAVNDGEELLIAATPSDFPECIRRLTGDPELRRRIGEKARTYAIGLDYRTHFQPYADTICRLIGRSRSSAEPRRKTLILVDNHIKDRVGHHLNYAASIREQCMAQKIPFLAFVRKGAPEEVLAEVSGLGVFSRTLREDPSLNPFPSQWGNMRSTYDFLASNDQFSRELEAGLAGTARPGDIVFLPNASPREILGIALLLQRSPLYRTLQFVLLLRYSLFNVTGPISSRKTSRDHEEARLYETTIGRLAEVDQGESVRFATDSKALAEEYTRHCHVPVEVFPIPHTALPRAAGEVPTPSDKAPHRIRVVFLGDAREEKGFEFLPAVIRACLGNPALASVEFVIQAFISDSYHAPMARVIGELEGLKDGDRVRLVPVPLAPDQYRGLLESADLVLLPYDSATYRSRTSGPFVEAICANKPVVVPRHSWMSAELGESRAGVSFDSGNGPDLVRAVVAVLGNLPMHMQAAAELGERFRTYHNSDRFVAHLMNGG